MLVTEQGYPHGVKCGGCRKVIEPGQPYKLRDLETAKLSSGPCTEDRADGVFCADC